MEKSKFLNQARGEKNQRRFVITAPGWFLFHRVNSHQFVLKSLIRDLKIKKDHMSLALNVCLILDSKDYQL